MDAPRMQPSFEAIDRPGGLARVGLLRPLRASRDFRVLWAGMTVSLIGDGIFLIAVSWTAFKLWNAPGALAVIGIAMTVPTICCLLAGGAVSDRFDRRRVLIVSDVARACSVMVLAALGFTGALTFPLLAILCATYSAAGAFFTPAFEAIVPSIVDADDLPAANALDQFVRPLALRLIGPALGGVLVAALGVPDSLRRRRRYVWGIDRRDYRAQRSTSACCGRGFDTCRDQARFSLRPPPRLALGHTRLCRHRIPRVPRATEVLVPYLVKNELHGSAADLGIVYAAGGIGAIAAAVLMAQHGQPRRDVTFMYGCWTAATLAVAGYGLARSTIALALSASHSTHSKPPAPSSGPQSNNATFQTNCSAASPVSTG